ncbi:MAG TPA: hypothetical protein VME45_08610 [Stellaceae bacterium]|nr:hypothetical protein [Stellaceae bacterium]
MRPMVTFVMSAALALTLQPAFAQSPSASTMPPGTQNPAIAQPHLVTPPGGPVASPTTSAQPEAPPAATPEQPASSASVTPDATGAGGLCQCLTNQGPKVPPLDQTQMHQSCRVSVEACQTECQTDHYYSWVPHAVFTCPGPSTPAPGHIAMSRRPAMLLLSRR